jgi:RHS repeat-associated protein
MVSVDGRISTVAGDGTLPVGRTPDMQMPGPAARLGQVREVAVHPDGRLFFIESFFSTLQVLSPQRGLSLGERAVGGSDGTELYIFDASGRHRRTLDTLTGTVTFRFDWDASGRLQSVTDRNGDTTEVLREPNGRFAGFKARDGQVVTASTDDRGRVASLADAASRTVRIGWNDAGLPASWEDANGNLSQFRYDTDGRLEADLDALQGERLLTREATPGGYTVSFRTPEGRLTQYGYSEVGPLKSYRNVFSDGTTIWVRASGGTTAMDSPDGTFTVTRLASDSRFGSQSTYPSSVTTTLPSGLSRVEGMKRTVTLATPGDVSQVARLEEEAVVNGKRWVSVYTAADRTLRVTSPLGRVSSVTVDEKARPVSWVAPGILSTSVMYDPRGRPSTVSQGTRRFALTYGPNGFVDTATDALSRVSRMATDVTGRTQSVTRPDMASSVFDWDATGNLTSLTPPGKPAHTFRYSKLDEVTAYTPPPLPGVGEETYGWTKDSLVQSVTHPDGTRTTFVRDRAGRVERAESPWATTTFDYSMTTGQVVASTRGTQRLEYRYDGFLPVSETAVGEVSGRVTRTYDSDFRVAEVAVNDAGVRYRYDDDGLVVSAGPESMSRVLATGQLQTATVGNVVTTYGFDGYGAPQSLETRAGASVVFREVLTWDDLGRVVVKEVTVQGATARWEYGYDGASRLASARRDGQVVGSWAYDGNGNRLSANGVTSTFDAQDRQLTAGATTFGHDAFGNRTRKTEGGQTTQYVYDGVGGLLSATRPDGTRLDYVIDARGRRVGKKRNGVLEKGWLYDGQLRVVAELDGTGAVVSRFVYGTLAHSPDVMVRGAATYRLVHDVLGSVRLVIDTATGQVQQRLDYDTWGVVTFDSNPGFQPFGFAGGLYDVDTRLTRFGARDYDADTGRWMSKDPIAFEGGTLNLFAYVGSRPVSEVDPTGLRVFGTFDSRSGVIKLSNAQGQSVSAFAYSGSPGFPDRSGPNAALPAGEYRIGYDSKPGYFTLDPIDDVPNNDKHDATGRGGFRLHIPGGSIGCIAIGRNVKDRSDSGANSAWLAVKQFIENNWEPFLMESWEKVGGRIRRPSYGTLLVK